MLHGDSGVPFLTLTGDRDLDTIINSPVQVLCMIHRIRTPDSPCTRCGLLFAAVLVEGAVIRGIRSPDGSYAVFSPLVVSILHSDPHTGRTVRNVFKAADRATSYFV